jgi:hypothetical protein
VELSLKDIGIESLHDRIRMRKNATKGMKGKEWGVRERG